MKPLFENVDINELYEFVEKNKDKPFAGLCGGVLPHKELDKK